MKQIVSTFKRLIELVMKQAPQVPMATDEMTDNINDVLWK